MKRIRLYRNPDCARCAGYARMHHRLDWLDRFEDSTENSPLGSLRIGEIAVQDIASGITLKGTAGFKLVCRQIPFYWFLLPLFYLPSFRAYVERETTGCNGQSCRIE